VAMTFVMHIWPAVSITIGNMKLLGTGSKIRSGTGYQTCEYDLKEQKWQLNQWYKVHVKEKL